MCFNQYKTYGWGWVVIKLGTLVVLKGKRDGGVQLQDGTAYRLVVYVFARKCNNTFAYKVLRFHG